MEYKRESEIKSKFINRDLWTIIKLIWRIIGGRFYIPVPCRRHYCRTSVSYNVKTLRRKNKEKTI